MKYALLFCTLILAGCTAYNETFDCEPGRGVGCKSLSQVNDMVNEGKLPLSIEEKPLDPIKPKISQKHLHIWIAQHIDEEGILHENSFISVPLKSGGTL